VNNWLDYRLKYLFTSVRNGVWGDDPDDDTDVYCARGTDFDRVTGRISGIKMPRRNVLPAALRDHQLQSGDLVLEKSGGSDDQPVGSVALFDLGIRAVCSNFNARLQVGSFADSRFICYLMNSLYSRGFTRQFIKQTTGIQNLDADALLAQHCLVPPLDEQRRIADFLDAETARIDHVEQLAGSTLDLIGERRRVLIEQVIVNSSDSTQKLFRCLLVLRDGTHQPPTRTPTGVPLLTARNVSSGTLRLTDNDTFVSEDDASSLEASLRPQPRDILLSVKGTIGAAAIVPAEFPRAVLDRNLALLRPLPTVINEWLVWALRTRYVQDQMWLSMAAAAQPGLPLGSIRELRIPDTDADSQEQQTKQIVKIDEQVADLESKIRTQRSLLAERRQALITAAVTGGITV
jgi:type I restriction enzyme, S subunit